MSELTAGARDASHTRFGRTQDVSYLLVEALEQALFVPVTLDACEHLVAVRPREEVHLKEEQP